MLTVARVAAHGTGTARCGTRRTCRTGASRRRGGRNRAMRSSASMYGSTVASREVDRGVACRGEVIVPRHLVHLRAEVACDVAGAVGQMRVDDDDLVDASGERPQAASRNSCSLRTISAAEAAGARWDAASRGALALVRDGAAAARRPCRARRRWRQAPAGSSSARRGDLVGDWACAARPGCPSRTTGPPGRWSPPLPLPCRPGSCRSIRRRSGYDPVGDATPGAGALSIVGLADTGVDWVRIRLQYRYLVS